MRILLWVSLRCLLYVYLGYPAVIALLVRLRPRPVNRRPNHPTVSLVIAAYNEKGTITRKIENALAVEYPKDPLEIVLASDGSRDRTAEIARQYPGSGVKASKEWRQANRGNAAHFMTAREMTNVVLAPCEGWEGNPGEYRDYRLRLICQVRVA